MIWNAYNYQRQGVNFVVDHPASGLFFDPGLGKTVTTLTAFDILSTFGFASSGLIVAPLRVAHSVWPVEVKKWDHLQHLDVDVLHGSKLQRLEVLKRGKGQLQVINPEGLDWLVKSMKYTSRTFDFLVVDESTKFKNRSSLRFKALCRLIKQQSIKRKVILTGTPTPESLIDLWGQIFLLDQGERLERTITAFRRKYCKKGGFKGKQWFLKEGVEPQIRNSVADIVLRLDARDHLDLPDLLVNDVMIDLPGSLKAKYDQFEKEMFTQLDAGETLSDPDQAAGELGIEVSTLSATGKYCTCKQFANGSTYRYVTEQEDDRYKEHRIVDHIHNHKVSALESIVSELQGRPALVFYQFHSDLELIRAAFGEDTPALHGGMKTKDVETILERWNKGEIAVLPCQPVSVAHGLNMQSGPCRDVIYFGLPESLEVYEQSYRRIYRQGVGDGPITIHRLLCRDTVEEMMRDRLDGKYQKQMGLLDSLKLYQKRLQG